MQDTDHPLGAWIDEGELTGIVHHSGLYSSTPCPARIGQELVSCSIRASSGAEIAGRRTRATLADGVHLEADFRIVAFSGAGRRAAR